MIVIWEIVDDVVVGACWGHDPRDETRQGLQLCAPERSPERNKSHGHLRQISEVWIGVGVQESLVGVRNLSQLPARER